MLDVSLHLEILLKYKIKWEKYIDYSINLKEATTY